MKKNITKWLCVLLAASLLTGCCLPAQWIAAGMAQWTPSPKPADLNVVIGEVATLKSVALQVEKIEKSNGDEYEKPEKGREFILVHVLIKNISSSIIGYSESDFQIMNSQGQTTDAAATVYDYDNQLNLGYLMPGAVAMGTVIFEQPMDSPALSLQYEDIMMFDGTKINVDLCQTAPGIKLLTRDDIKIDNDKAVGIGEENTLGATTIVLNKTQRFSGKEYYMLKEGMEYITLEVTVKNTGKLNLSYFSGNFMMCNSQGLLKYNDMIVSDDPEFSDTGFEDQLQEGNLIFGATATLTLSYLVKKGDTDLALIYKPSGISNKYLAFRIQ